MMGPSPDAYRKTQAHGFDGKEQVGKDDGRVHVQHFDGLQGDGGGDVRPLAHLENPVMLTNLAVLLHVAPSLAHKPTQGARQSGGAGKHLGSGYSWGDGDADKNTRIPVCFKKPKRKRR